MIQGLSCKRLIEVLLNYSMIEVLLKVRIITFYFLEQIKFLVYHNIKIIYVTFTK